MAWRGHRRRVLNLPKFVPNPQCVSAQPPAATTLSASHLCCLLPGLESRLPNWSPSPSLAPFQPTFQKFLTCMSDRATCLIDSFQGPTAWHRIGFRLQPSPGGSHQLPCLLMQHHTEEPAIPKRSPSPLPTCFLWLESFRTSRRKSLHLQESAPSATSSRKPP